MTKALKQLIILSLALSFLVISAKITSAIPNLNGRILLQVQEKGQAWYVNPSNSLRYYLGRPADAFTVMRELGLGISNRDFDNIKNNPPQRLLGKILLKVEDKGRAYYIDPLSHKLYYLGRPADAFRVMRNLGLGISNQDLKQINQFVNNDQRYNFKYNNKDYYLDLNLTNDLYTEYKNTSKIYTYNPNNPPKNIRDEYYKLILKQKDNDDSIGQIANRIKDIANIEGLDDDETVELALAFVQYIPYDHDKLSSSEVVIYHPYETLFLDKGVCSDKTLLAVLVLRELGYGAVILDMPDINHSAVGIQCPQEDSLRDSGYCYVETTNYFPPGLIPQSINGQAKVNINNLTNLFNDTSLGEIKMYQKTIGKVFNGVSKVKERVKDLQLLSSNNIDKLNELNALKQYLDEQEVQIKAWQGDMETYLSNNQISEYNALVIKYNTAINKYNDDLAVYKEKVNLYNQSISKFNSDLSGLYQKGSE